MLEVSLSCTCASVQGERERERDRERQRQREKERELHLWIFDVFVFLQGLKVGDRIIDVNGTDFTNLTHAEAVTMMRNAWNIIMTVESDSATGTSLNYNVTI